MNANLLHRTILDNKLDGWRDGGIKEKKLMLAVNQIIQDADTTLSIMDIIKSQNEYSPTLLHIAILKLMWLEKTSKKHAFTVHPPHGRIRAGFSKKTDEEVRLTLVNWDENTSKLPRAN
jgi:hypothetical protein